MIVARLVLGFVLLCLPAAPVAHATRVVQLDTRALTLGSSDIVIGEVESVTSRWNAARTLILTDVTVRVTRSLKGAGERVVVTQPGGTVGDVRTTVPGCPAFAVGEEALLFLWRDARGRAQVTGLGQGKFEIHRDPATGDRMIQRATPGFAIRDARRLALTRPGEAAPPLRLSDLVHEIERTLAGTDR